MDTDNVKLFTQLLQLSIVPVVLISAVGLLLLSFTNRLGRCIDRSRLLIKEIEGDMPGKQDYLQAQLRVLIQRARLLRAAICGAALSIFFAGAMIAGLFFLLFLAMATKGFVLSVYILSIFSLMGSLILFLMDIFASLKALFLETSHVM